MVWPSQTVDQNSDTEELTSTHIHLLESQMQINLKTNLDILHYIRVQFLLSNKP